MAMKQKGSEDQVTETSGVPSKVDHDAVPQELKTADEQFEILQQKLKGTSEPEKYIEDVSAEPAEPSEE